MQESVHDVFVKKVKERMTHLRVSDSLDKSTDMGAIVDPSQVVVSDQIGLMSAA